MEEHDQTENMEEMEQEMEGGMVEARNRSLILEECNSFIKEYLDRNQLLRTSREFERECKEQHLPLPRVLQGTQDQHCHYTQGSTRYTGGAPAPTRSSTRYTMYRSSTCPFPEFFKVNRSAQPLHGVLSGIWSSTCPYPVFCQI